MRVFLLFLAAWMLAGCNAMEGLGKDLKKGGEEIQKAVKK